MLPLIHCVSMLNMIADSATTLGFCRSLVLGEVMFLVLPPLQLCDNVHSSLCASYNLPESYFIGTAPAAVLRIGCAGVKGHQKKDDAFICATALTPNRILGIISESLTSHILANPTPSALTADMQGL